MYPTACNFQISKMQNQSFDEKFEPNQMKLVFYWVVFVHLLSSVVFRLSPSSILNLTHGVSYAEVPTSSTYVLFLCSSCYAQQFYINVLKSMTYFLWAELHYAELLSDKCKPL